MSDAPFTPQGAEAPAAEAPTAGLVTLAGLLNILWRRKLIIIVLTLAGFAAGVVYISTVTPLFRATAQVQPGITAFTEGGGPVREWHLKDIVRFYRRGLYEDDLNQRLDRPAGLPRPIIQAEFIPRGSQGIQGGNIITLETLSPTPEEARSILEAAIGAFNAFAEADTIASGIYLTRHGLEVRIADLENQVEQLGTEKERLTAKITESEAEIARIGQERELIQIDLDRVNLDNAYRQRNAIGLDAEAQAKREGAGVLQKTADEVKSAGIDSPARRDSLLARRGDDGLAALLLESGRSSSAEAVGELVQGSLRMRSDAFDDQAAADSLRHANDMAELYVRDLKIKRGVELDKREVEARTQAADLTLERDFDLVHQRIALQQQIRGLRAQLQALSSLERIGTITTSKRAVRPRRMRAVTILTGLGFLGSIALAFVLEYLSQNRNVILARRPRRG